MTKTRQELFDNAYNGVIAQGGYSYDGSLCLYRDKNTGNKCGIGHSIPDDKYRESLEGTGVYSGNEVQLAADIAAADVMFAIRIQNIHDNAAQAGAPLDMFKTSMQDLAKMHGLDLR